MKGIRRILARAANLVSHQHQDERLRAEIEEHIALQTEENIHAGISPADARRQALLKFGAVEEMKEVYRDQESIPFIENLLRDLKYGLRMLRKSPGFTAVAVITLALGIGANTAVFSVMNAVLLRMLPVRDPSRLYYVRIGGGQNVPPGAGDTGNGDTSFSEPVFEALRQRKDVLDDLIADVPLGIGKVAVRHSEMPEEAEGDEVSGNFFSGLTADFARGHGFTLDDEKQHAAVAVVSYGYWTRRFGRDPSALGSTLFVKNVPFTIIGVTAPGFTGIGPGQATDFWVPLQNRPELNAWGMPQTGDTLYGSPRWWCLPMMARLKTGITPQQAQTMLASTFDEAAKTGIGNIDPTKWRPLLDFDVAEGIQGYKQFYSEPLKVLMGLVLLVLLIACTDVALLLMARNESRQREFSLKLAIGASKAQLFRQLLAESSLLVAAGAALGWLFADFATTALAAWSGIESGLQPDRNVLWFTLATSVAIAVGFGLAPLWVALRAPVSGVLRATAPSLTSDRHHALLGRVMMASQLAICLLLLVAAGLLLRTLRNYEQQNLGMDVHGLVVFGVTPQSARTSAETSAFYRTLLDRIRALPGVEAVTFMRRRIGSGWSDNNNVMMDGAVVPDVIVRSNHVGPDYFHTLGIPIVRGRDITDVDTEATQPVAVINETFASRLLHNTSPLGHMLNKATIVGVAADSKYTSVDESPRPMAWYGVLHRPGASGTMHFEVRTSGRPQEMIPTLRRVVHDVDAKVPLESPMTQQAQFEETYASQKLFARLAVFFGILAALLVATGLYGTLAYRTNRRTAEIGVRMALGARRRQIIWMVMRESVLLAVAGVAVGLPLALASVHLLKTMLYQMSAFDPVSFVLALVAMTILAALAAFIPARRATKVDPMVALRYE